MDETIVKQLIELKFKYFGSKFFSLDNWVTFNYIELPEGVETKDIEDWAEEKQHYLAKSKIEMEGLRSAYERIVIDRLDTAAALQEKIIELLHQVSTSKDAKEIALTMDKIAKLQDEAMEILKVDAYRSNLYEKNKTATENLLRENIIEET